MPLENKNAILGSQIGVSIQYYPVKAWEKLSLINEISLVQKGYGQDLDEDYSFRFSYLSFPVLVNYSVTTRFALQGGIEFSQLQSTNIEGGTSTFNRFDTGLVFGIIGFSNKRLSLYARYTYGLLPMFDFQPIDEWGNFGPEQHDFRNSSLAVGIQIKLHNEKINLFR